MLDDDDMESALLKAFQERESALGPANQYKMQHDAEEEQAASAESDKMVHEWLKSQGMGDAVPAPADYDYARMLKDGVYPKAGEGGMPLPPQYWKPGKMIVGGVDIATGQRIESQVPAHDFQVGMAEYGDDNAAPVDLGEMWSMITQDDLSELSSRERKSLEAWMGSHGIQLAQGGTQGTASDAPPAARVGRAGVPYKPPSIKDLTAPLTALWDAMAGTLKGGVSQTAGFFGDLRSIADLVTGGRAKEVLGDRLFPTTEEVSAALPPVIPKNSVTDLVTGGDPSRQHSAKMGQEFGEVVGLGKAPLVAAKAAIKGAKVLAPTAKEMARKGIERVVDSTGARLNLSAYHGTPHNWSQEPGFPNGRPNLDNIGTGEGAQAYGWGFYSAESKGVASYYKDGDGYSVVKSRDADGVVHSPHRSRKFGDYFVLESDDIPEETLTGSNAYDFMRERLRFEISSRRVLMEKPRTYYTMSGGQTTPEEQVILNASRDSSMKKEIEKIESAIVWLDDAQKRGRDLEVPGRDQQGNLFHLDIPDETVAKMMSWDEPLSAQPKNVQDAIKEFADSNPHIFENMAGQDILKMDPTGEDIYQRLKNHYSMAYARETGERFAGDRAASRALKEFDIPGLKYLDGNSRKKGKGTHNFVIWDQDVLDETAKRGIKKVVE